MTVRQKSSERLIAKLRSQGVTIPDGAKFRRLYPGHWQRSSGHWVWTIEGALCDIGSCDTVRDCLRADYFGYLPNGELVAEIHKPNAGSLAETNQEEAT